MYKLFLKIAIRYLLKNKLYSFINIFGLAIGVASFILIMVYVNHERSYDKFEGSEHVYRIYMDYLEGDNFVGGDAQTYNLSGPTMKREFPDVLEYVRFFYLEKATFVLGDRIIEQPMGSMADASYFEIFGYPLMKGDKETALKEPNTIVLSATLAKKLFGEENPLQKTLSVFSDGDEVVLTVTGVMEDIPQTSHFKNNYLISYETEKTWGFGENHIALNFNANNFYTYIKVDKNADIDLLRDKITSNNADDNLEERHNIEALEDIHLYSDKPYEVSANGSVTRIKFLSAIAFIILILSWLNYINLSTTTALERAKETGIRKVVGAHRSQLVVQSLMESMLLNVIAIVVGVALSLIVLPIYNKLTENSHTLDLVNSSNLLPVFGFILLGMFLAGLYPALLLSGYSPSKALKGEVRTSANGISIRKGLIITQFLATIILLIGTIVVTKQINFLQDQPIGANINQIIALKGEVVTDRSDSLLIDDFKLLSTVLKELPFVEKMSIAQTYAGDSFDNLPSTRGIVLPNGIENESQIFYTYHVHSDYFDLVDIPFVAGGTFLPTASGDSRQVAVNETFVREMGLGSAEEVVGETLEFWGNNEWTVSGVFKDYHHFGLKTKVEPMLIRNQKEVNNLLVKLDASVTTTGGFTDAIDQIRGKWSQIFPKSTFNYTFLDKKFELQYKEDKNFGKAFQIFTILAILIASMGLFGLTSYTILQRKKEIGIRKVNGASIAQILKLLNEDFVKWVGLAFLIAVPISWYAMGKWLEGFAYKTAMSLWIFALAGFTALAIALLTVSWQSFKAATNNPVDALRDE